MKRTNKILHISWVLFIIFSTFSNVFASDMETTLDIIQNSSEIKYLENDQGYISKTIIDSNSDTGEVTVEVKLSNTKKEQIETNNAEIFFVVDNSGSMGYPTSTGEIRRDIVVKSMKSLVNSIYDNSSNVKVGLIRFAYTGNLLTSSTALMCNLTDNKQTMLNAISEYENLDTSVEIDGLELPHCESGTNIEAGLKKANDNFSSGCENKILILLTDGIPNASISYTTESYVYNATKTRLQKIGNSGVSVISLMTGITEADDEGAQEIVEQIFGTESNPTTGKFYNIADANLETVVTQDILADVMEKIQNPINTVKIVDYFPEDITENFEFSYVGNPNVGKVTEQIDKETNTITWDIDTLKGEEVATLQYKLKIKDMKNEELLNKTISTNEKIVLTYKDVDEKDYTVTLSSSPKIQLSELKEELTAIVSYNPITATTTNVTATIKTNKKVNKVDGWTLSEDQMTLTKVYSTNKEETVHLVDIDRMTKDVVVNVTNIMKVDNTTANGTIPQTGENITIIIAIIVTVLFLVIFYKKYTNYKGIK